MGAPSGTRIELQFNNPQRAALGLVGQDKQVAIPWGRGVGKSWWMRQRAYVLIAMHEHQRRPGRSSPGCGIVCMMDTLKHFKDVHGSDYRHEIEHGQWSFLGGKIDKVTQRCDFPGGSWFQPFPAAEHTAKGARGLRPDAVIVDEADDVDLHVFHGVITPWFTPDWTLGQIIIGGTPRRGRRGLLYWAHSLGLSREPEHAEFHTVHAWYKHCLGHGPGLIRPKQVEKARATTPPTIFRREWEADFDSAEGLVYDCFDEHHHVRCPPDGTIFHEILVGVDWGYADPGVFLVVGISGHGADASAWVIEEHYEPGLVIGQWADKARDVASRYPNARWFADPSRPDAIKTLKKSAGIKITGADNAIEDGVARVADMLFRRRGPNDGADEGKARLYVHPDCKNTIAEFGEYRRKKDPRDPDNYLEAIEDKNNHAMDSLKYLLLTRFGRVRSTRKTAHLEDRQVA